MGNFHSEILTAVFQGYCWSPLDCVGLGLPALCRAVLGNLEETRRKEAWFLTSRHLQAPLGDRAHNEMIISRQKWLVAPLPATRKQEAFWRPGLALNSTDLVIPSAAGVKWMSLTCRTPDSRRLEDRLRVPSSRLEGIKEASETPLMPFQPHLYPIIASKAGAQPGILGVICGHGNAKEDDVSILTAHWCAEHSSPWIIGKNMHFAVSSKCPDLGSGGLLSPYQLQDHASRWATLSQLPL
ncbi:uncharacterized protein LOC114206132 [Eumetopias jubatus]|uniref:uncharacterized protein LOC114206132 n=1 Tax=Eumetopias jubatus TaxID=34886 RepID=UPI0010167E11|nr:uncharacterized protein LOC114206132 [Eumetopias jubatus]XP_027955549.1 uncharacterized protein LOC114206132 [Eumetopias jubatus]XP_027955550.1 uncharacterized protein LOC114206132 [Eumetopias jubatus]XP_027955551.1 uncharacterized protein LOC114206132 [Eumetopias jubatus]XP_027955552.1 uncharacterized protein LOC114206132 [Eumetopias jubatus]